LRNLMPEVIIKKAKRISSIFIRGIQGSLNRELSLAVFFCLIVSGAVYWQVQDATFELGGGIVEKVNNSNSAFVGINQLYAGRNDKEAGADDIVAE